MDGEGAAVDGGGADGLERSWVAGLVEGESGDGVLAIEAVGAVDEVEGAAVGVEVDGAEVLEGEAAGRVEGGGKDGEGRWGERGGVGEQLVAALHGDVEAGQGGVEDGVAGAECRGVADCGLGGELAISKAEEFEGAGVGWAGGGGVVPASAEEDGRAGGVGADLVGEDAAVELGLRDFGAYLAAGEEAVDVESGGGVEGGEEVVAGGVGGEVDGAAGEGGWRGEGGERALGGDAVGGYAVVVVGAGRAVAVGDVEDGPGGVAAGVLDGFGGWGWWLRV